MKKWSFYIERNPQETVEILESALIDRFVFTINRDRDDSVSFKLRKRILYIWYMYFHNWTIASGKLNKTETADKTNVEVSFNQHWFILLIAYSQMLLGLGFIIAIISGFSASSILPGIILLALGVILWIVIKMKLKKDIQEYKSLIYNILEI